MDTPGGTRSDFNHSALAEFRKAAKQNGRNLLSGKKKGSVGAPKAFCFELLQLVAGGCNAPKPPA
jgi:hypothetical protein